MPATSVFLLFLWLLFFILFLFWPIATLPGNSSMILSFAHLGSATAEFTIRYREYSPHYRGRILLRIQSQCPEDGGIFTIPRQKPENEPWRISFPTFRGFFGHMLMTIPLETWRRISAELQEWSWVFWVLDFLTPVYIDLNVSATWFQTVQGYPWTKYIYTNYQSFLSTHLLFYFVFSLCFLIIFLSLLLR